jgi:hypothetical protein
MDTLFAQLADEGHLESALRLIISLGPVYALVVFCFAGLCGWFKHKSLQLEELKQRSWRNGLSALGNGWQPALLIAFISLPGFFNFGDGPNSSLLVTLAVDLVSLIATSLVMVYVLKRAFYHHQLDAAYGVWVSHEKTMRLACVSSVVGAQVFMTLFHDVFNLFSLAYVFLAIPGYLSLAFLFKEKQALPGAMKSSWRESKKRWSELAYLFCGLTALRALSTIILALPMALVVLTGFPLLEWQMQLGLYFTRFALIASDCLINAVILVRGVAYLEWKAQSLSSDGAKENLSQGSVVKAGLN